MAHQNHYAMKASGKSQRSIFTHRSGRNTGVSVLLALCAIVGTQQAEAQLKVNDSGAVTIGIGTSTGAPLTITNTTSATGNSYINFTNNANGIGSYNSGTDLTLKGSSYLFAKLSDVNIFSAAYRKLPSGEAVTSFVFNCDVNGPAFNVTSDMRLKKDVRPLSELSTGLDELSTVSYRLVHSAPVQKEGISGKETATTSMQINTEDRTRFGFIAQEVKEIYPNLVSEDENGYLSVDYMGFIPLLVEEIKNLKTKIEQQQQEIETLTGNSRKIKAGVNTIVGLEDAVLGQNRPNPFTLNTIIECAIPQRATTARIIIYDLQGQQLMQLPIEGKGNVTVTVDGSKLRAGMYIYTLLIDGIEIDTKRMILTD